MKKILLTAMIIATTTCGINAQTQRFGGGGTGQTAIPGATMNTTLQLPISGTATFSGFSNFTGSFTLETSGSRSTSATPFLGVFNSTNLLVIRPTSTYANDTDNNFLNSSFSETLSFKFSNISITPNTAGYVPDLKLTTVSVSHLGATGETFEFLKNDILIQTFTATDSDDGVKALQLTTPISIVNGDQITIKTVTNNSVTPAVSANMRVAGFTLRDMNEVVLPITLSSFTANSTAQNVNLNWSTSSEKNNSHFNILRAGEDNNFTKIGQVTGSNNSDQKQYYEFKDNSPLSGNNYYKLEQVDFDGKSETFGPVAANFSLNGEAKLAVSKIAEGKINVQLSSAQASNAMVSIFDLSGKQVFKSNINLTEGNNNLELSISTSLNSGIYLVTVQTKNNAYKTKLVY
ncbi:hypothetical protein PBAC_04240 [Pedobacter glucosidilyticus]|nr:T9SS type A sorting domain-containing protein [Pedobacter glucosidilyticus]KHJ39438.1 hypothetical protein PBAC_04240 [Pedobacter glucosidilyticus]